MKMGNIVGVIIGIAIAAIVTASILPTAFNNIADANITSAANGAAVYAVWGLLGTVIGLAVLMAFFKYVHI